VGSHFSLDLFLKAPIISNELFYHQMQNLKKNWVKSSKSSLHSWAAVIYCRIWEHLLAPRLPSKRQITEGQIAKYILYVESNPNDWFMLPTSQDSPTHALSMHPLAFGQLSFSHLTFGWLLRHQFAPDLSFLKLYHQFEFQGQSYKPFLGRWK